MIAKDTPQQSKKDEGTLSVYMREVAKYSLLSAQQERAAAEEIEVLRAAYWRAVLDFPPLLEAIVAHAHASLVDDAPDPELGQACAEATAAAAAVRQRDRKALHETLAAATSILAGVLAARDRECEVADRVVADLRRFRAGEKGLAIAATLPRRDSKPYADFVAAIETRANALRAARNRFARANLRLVVRMANRLRGSGMPLVDLVQEGNIGLLKAVDRFEPARGFRFSTYATWWIGHAMRRAVANRGRTVRVPQHLHTLRGKVSRAKRHLLLELGREPSVAELAAALGVTVAKVRAALQIQRVPVSLDAQGDFSTSMLEQLPADDPDPAEGLDASRVEERMRAALGALDPMARDIITRRFGLDGHRETLAAVGKRHGLSRERIRQLQVEALERMRSLVGVS